MADLGDSGSFDIYDSRLLNCSPFHFDHLVVLIVSFGFLMFEFCLSILKIFEDS